MWWVQPTTKSLLSIELDTLAGGVVGAALHSILPPYRGQRRQTIQVQRAASGPCLRS